MAEADKVPKEELVIVSYITRTVGNSGQRHWVQSPCVYFERTKQIYHTEESFPLALCLKEDRYHFDAQTWMEFNTPHSRIRVPERFEVSFRGHRPSWISLMPIWSLLIVTAAATSFPVVFIAVGDWTWPRAVGSIFGLACSSFLWAYVYIQEQLAEPAFDDDYERFGLLSPANYNGEFVMCNLRAIPEKSMIFYRVASLAFPASISVR